MTVTNPVIDNTKPTTDFWNGTGWSNNVIDPNTGDLEAEDTGTPGAGDDVFLSGYLGSSPYPTSGSVTFSGQLGNLSANNGPWSIIGNATFYAIGEYTDNVTYITPKGSTVLADGVYINEGSSVDLTNTNAVTFDGSNATLGINGISSDLQVDGYDSSDVVDFTADNPSSSLFSDSTDNDSVARVYTSSTKVADYINFTDLSGSESDQIKPVTDGNGGTELVEDSDTSLIDPDENQIDWTLIHGHESLYGVINLSPYKGFSAKSGVTVGFGVDLGSGIFTAAVFATIFGANWQSDPNLVWLSKTNGDTSVSATTDITSTYWKNVNGNPTTEEVSLTLSQAYQITQYAETALYNELIAKWNANSAIQFSSLSSGAATVLMDLDYNYGGPSLFSKAWFISAEKGNWLPLLQSIVKREDSDNKGVAARATDQYNELAASPEINNQIATVPAKLQQTSGSVTGNVTGGTQTAIGRGTVTITPTSSLPTQNIVLRRAELSDLSAQSTGGPNGTFVFEESSGSPTISTITLPSFDADHYQVSTLQSGVWSSFQEAEPDQTISFPDGTSGVQVTLLDDNDNPVQVSGTEDFTFYLTFSSSGNVSGSVFQEGVVPLVAPAAPQDPSPAIVTHDPTAPVPPSSPLTKDAYSWSSTSDGSWGVASNWLDDVTGSAAPNPPEAGNPVTIMGPATEPPLTVSGPGDSASLTIEGNTALSGTFNTGALAVGKTGEAGTLDLTGSSTLGASSAEVVDGTLNISGSDSVLNVGSTLSLNPSQSNTLPVSFNTVNVTGGAKVQVGSLAFVSATTSTTYGGFSYVTVDSSSSFEIGSLGSAAAGMFTVDPGSTFTGSGSIVAPQIVVNGNVSDQGVIQLGGAESGSGLIQIGATGYLAIDENSVSTGSVAFNGNGGTLAISYSSRAGQLNEQGTISSFAPGDTIVYDGNYLGVSNPLTAAVYTASSANSGTLTLKDGSTVLGTLNLTGNYADEKFLVTPGVAAGTYDISPTEAPGSDFNGDGNSDILFQNSNGSIDTWLMNGASVSSGAVIANPGTSWHAVATGDFNGDGKSDILFQNDDGTVDIWLLNGQTVTSGTVIANPGPSWHIVGIGDFNGDGKSDIVFQNNDGSVDIWEMNGTTVLAGTVIANPGTSWHVVGTGDFEGTGQTDLLLQNDDGTIETWQTNGTSLTSGTVVANPGPAWHIVGTGDFNGDGKSDIVLQNNNGTVNVWEMNGSTIASSTQVADPGPAWHAVSVGDYNGDGKPDILFQNDKGTVETWLMNGTSVVSGSVVANPGTAWQAVGQGSIHFIDGTQSTGTLAGTILNDDFVFTTSLPGTHAITSFDPLHDVISLDQTKFGSYAAVQAAETTVNGSTVLTLGTNDTLTINGVLPGALAAKNFV